MTSRISWPEDKRVNHILDRGFGGRGRQTVIEVVSDGQAVEVVGCGAVVDVDHPGTDREDWGHRDSVDVDGSGGSKDAYQISGRSQASQGHCLGVSRGRSAGTPKGALAVGDLQVQVAEQVVEFDRDLDRFDSL